MSVVEEAIEHGGDSGAVTQQFAPVLHRSVGSEQCAGALVASHTRIESRPSGKPEWKSASAILSKAIRKRELIRVVLNCDPL